MSLERLHKSYYERATKYIVRRFKRILAEIKKMKEAASEYGKVKYSIVVKDSGTSADVIVKWVSNNMDALKAVAYEAIVVYPEWAVTHIYKVGKNKYGLITSASIPYPKLVKSQPNDSWVKYINKILNRYSGDE